MAGGGAVPDDGRRGEHPGCSWSREEEKRREEKGKRKGKEKGEKERKGEKGGKEGGPAGFAAMVAIQAWHRREAECTPNEENMKIR